MSIADDYKAKIEQLIHKRSILQSIENEVPEVHMEIANFNTEIMKLESRLNKFTRYTEKTHCYQCKQWVEVDEKEITHIDGKLICPHCINTIQQTYTSTKAEELWNLAKGTIKRDCARGKLKKYENAGLLFKSANNWIVHELVSEFYKKDK